MNIKAALQQPYTRLTNSNNRWLITNWFGREYVVYERKPYARKTTQVYRGTDEEEAVAALLNLDEDEQDDYGYAEQKNFD